MDGMEATRNPFAVDLGMNPNAEKENSRKDFRGKAEGDLEMLAERLQENATGKEGLGASNAVNQDAVARASTPIANLLAGSGAGGLLEMSTIAIGFVQNFGLVILIEVCWPTSFEVNFQWLEIFSLDFGAFGGAQLGTWTTIWTGLLRPPGLVLEI